MFRSQSRFLVVGSLALFLATPPALRVAAHAGPSSRDGGNPAGSPDGPSAQPNDSYVVVLNDGTADVRGVANDHERRLGVEVDHVYRYALKGYAARMSPAGVEGVRSDPRVRVVTPDREVHASAALQLLLDLGPDVQTLPTGVDRIEGDLSSTKSGDGTGTVTDPAVAIIDTGIDDRHPDLNVVGGVNCRRDAEPEDYRDDNGHGTHVAGIVAAKDDSSGVVGVAPGAPLYAVKVLSDAGSGLISEVICGIDWVTEHTAADNIKVANMSLGGSGSDDGNCGRSNDDPFHEAICNSVAAGVTHVVAAGNDDADFAGSTPAAYDEVLTVTAMSDSDGMPGGTGGSPSCRSGESDDASASFSNWTRPNSRDAAHTIAAPGVCIESTWLDGRYATLSGTSMASPHVAGTATLCIASGACAGLAPGEIIAELRADAAAQPPDYGFEGIVSLPESSRNLEPTLARVTYGALVYAADY